MDYLETRDFVWSSDVRNPFNKLNKFLYSPSSHTNGHIENVEFIIH